MNYTIGEGTHLKLSGVCSTAFAKAYGIGESTLEEYRSTIALGYSVCSPVAGEVPISDRAAFTDDKFRRQLILAMRRRGRELSKEQIAALAIPCTEVSQAAYAWMDSWFNTVGDIIPTVSEIHLEPMYVKEIHAEYKLDQCHRHLTSLEVNAFCEIWRSCFGHVKIREFKAVSGKCTICALLSHARKTFRDAKSREHITRMHALHRTMYMGERIAYNHRRNYAMAYPSLAWSFIADGMAQVHCVLPYSANLKQFGKPLSQHLQAVYHHGTFISIFRTFHNVQSGANLQIYSFLLALEQARQHHGFMAPTINLQIDGATDNVAKSVIGMCELMVARRLVTKIILTRLPVGHTHEDVDGKFALIWRRIRDSHVLTPSQYDAAIRQALQYKDPVRACA